jgi:acyl-coenzyme A synthetase/AMP-(fatty) acid ligase
MHMLREYNSLQSLPPLADNIQIPLLDPFIPEQTLVIDKGRAVTQQEFLTDLAVLVTQLPDKPFALNLCEDRYYFMLAFCALLIKGTVNLLPPNRQTLALTELAADYPDCYCLFDRSQACNLPFLIISEHLNTDEKTIVYQRSPKIPAQQIAAIAFTSGSTGKPQANKKCWGTLAATARLLHQDLFNNLDPLSQKIVATVPSQHMYGLELTIMMALQTGMILVNEKPFFAADVQQLLLTLSSPAILITTPIHLRTLVNAELAMPQLAKIISATAPLDITLGTQAEILFQTSLWEIYGCTEAGSMATRHSTKSLTWSLLPQFYFREKETLMFADAPHLRETALIQDQLELIDARQFLLLGRNADMINVAGKRASLANLTQHLLAIRGIKDGVFFLPSQESQTELRPVALVVSDLTEKEILLALSQKLDSAFLPRPLRKVDKLPRNETGKLTQKALTDLWETICGKH